MVEHEEIKSGPGRVVWIVVSLCAAGAALVGAWFYAQGERDKAQLEVRRNTYALCVAQNTAREANRQAVLSIYKLVASVLNAGGPTDPRQHTVFVAQEKELSRQLRALKPLDCTTYTRPDIPPDQGVE